MGRRRVRDVSNPVSEPSPQSTLLPQLLSLPTAMLLLLLLRLLLPPGRSCSSYTAGDRLYLQKNLAKNKICPTVPELSRKISTRTVFIGGVFQKKPNLSSSPSSSSSSSFGGGGRRWSTLDSSRSTFLSLVSSWTRCKRSSSGSDPASESDLLLLRLLFRRRRERPTEWILTSSYSGTERD